MIKCIIVEDDPKHSRRLNELILKLNQPFEVVATCINIEIAYNAIIKLKPELVFLDIELDGNKTAGFDLLSQLEKVNFDVIFTTAHIDKNISDIRACGLDYIAKPYIIGELQDAITKFLNKRDSQIGNQQINALRQNLVAELISEKVIWISDGNTFVTYPIKNIIYCQSDNQYTDFHLSDEKGKLKKVTSTKGIGEWEKELEKYNFCRIHNRTLINTMHVKKYIKGDVGEVVLSNDIKLLVSKTYKQGFLVFVNIK